MTDADEELVAVPRTLLGAACAAIRGKRNAPNTLSQLNRYAVHGPALAKPASEPAGGGVREAAIEAAVAAMEDDLFIDDYRLRGTTQNGDRLRHYATIAVDAALPSPASSSPAEASYPVRVAQACAVLFEGDPTDVAEHRDRFAEEANEVCQAFGMTREEAHALVDYTYGRPVGEPGKEIGAAMTTLASLANEAGYGLMECAEADLAKLNRPETIARIRAKRATRHGRGPLPGLSEPAEAEALPAGVAGEDIWLLDRLKRDNVHDGARPVIGGNVKAWDQARRLSDFGLIAIEQIAVGGRLHITRKGVKTLADFVSASAPAPEERAKRRGIISRDNDQAHLDAARAAYFAAGGRQNDARRAQKVSRIQIAIANGADGILDFGAIGGDPVARATAYDHGGRPAYFFTEVDGKLMNLGIGIYNLYAERKAKPMAEAHQDPPSFTLQEIINAAVTGSTKIAVKEFANQLEQRGVPVDVINAAIGALADRVSEFRKQFEGANLVQTMIDWKKDQGDGG